MPVRPKKRSTASLIGSPPRRVPAASLMSRTFWRLSTTKMVSDALVARAMARAIFSFPMTAVVMSKPGMPCAAEHFRFAQPRRAAADGAGADQRSSHFRALVRLTVRAEGLVARLHMRRHLRDVVFEGVEVEEQGRGRNLLAFTLKSDRRRSESVSPSFHRTAPCSGLIESNRTRVCSSCRSSRMVPGRTPARRASFTAVRITS